MTARPVVAVPIKPFSSAKGRLAASLDPDSRASLMRESASRVLDAAARAGALPLVVTGDSEVARWAHTRAIEVLTEPPGAGLDGAATAAADGALAAGAAWCIAHGDLPLLEPGHLTEVLEAAASGAIALAPSRNGGTNLLAASSAVRFSYGPASFIRHLSAAADRPRHVIVTTGTALDLDTPDDLRAAARRPGGEWLARYLG